MIIQLSAKYQIGAIHTADTTWRLGTESEKVHRLYSPSIVQTQFGDKPNRCSRRLQVVSWPNLTLFQTQTIGKLKPWHREHVVTFNNTYFDEVYYHKDRVKQNFTDVCESCPQKMLLKLGLCLGWYGHLMVLYKTKSAIPVTYIYNWCASLHVCNINKSSIIYTV